ncbi:MAG: HD-GYP domain-containing protein [Chloroflexia bacterium]|nr:HD-GYP domain-containing protein [Chloroflexia bacterium]
MVRLSRAPPRPGVNDRLRAYLVAVIVAGPAVATAVAIADPARVPDDAWFATVVLVCLAVVAVAFPVSLRHQTQVSMVGAAALALVLSVPMGAAGVIAYGGALAGRLARKRGGLGENLFNAGQAAAYVTAAAVCFAALRSAAVPGPEIERVGPLVAVVVAILVLYLVNFTLVSGAVALQVGASPWRVWRKHVGRDGVTEAAIYGIGIVAALLAATYPWALVILVIPVYYFQQSLRRANQLQSDTYDALAHLVGLLELRDPYTAGHSERVGIIARLLAVRLGLTAEEADIIGRAGRVHDIGKVVVDPGILNKAGALNAAERLEVRRHATDGAAVIAKFSAFGREHQFVRSHHERWDGNGYPDGLAGEAIPFGARVVGVADAFDALNSHRAYQAAKEPGAIARIFREGAGKQWDPRVVEALLEVLADHEARQIAPLDPPEPVSAATVA